MCCNWNEQVLDFDVFYKKVNGSINKSEPTWQCIDLTRLVSKSHGSSFLCSQALELQTIWHHSPQFFLFFFYMNAGIWTQALVLGGEQALYQLIPTSQLLLHLLLLLLLGVSLWGLSFTLVENFVSQSFFFLCCSSWVISLTSIIIMKCCSNTVLWP